MAFLKSLNLWSLATESVGLRPKPTPKGLTEVARKRNRTKVRQKVRQPGKRKKKKKERQREKRDMRMGKKDDIEEERK